MNISRSDGHTRCDALRSAGFSFLSLCAFVILLVPGLPTGLRLALIVSWLAGAGGGLWWFLSSRDREPALAVRIAGVLAFGTGCTLAAFFLTGAPF